MIFFYYKLINFLLILTLFNLGGCNQINPQKDINSKTSQINNSPSNPDENKLNLTVSILPQKYFVEKIGGELVTVNVMVEPGIAAETYEPLPQQLANLSQSSAYISTGVPFEETWLEKIKSANPQIPIINSGEGIDKMPMVYHDHEEEGHSHEDKEKNHDRKEGNTFDPHIWLSPKLAKIQAQNIYQELVKLDPKNEAIYKQNLDKFLTEIVELDRQISQKFADIDRRKFMIYHPAWSYFAKDYNLEQISIELEGQEATSGELANLIKQAKADNIKVVFAQPQFTTKTVDSFAREIGGEVILLDDLAENWSENLLQVADKLAQSMKNE
ncbi:metal ABC transporter solute-binding protein, Zn/Mn family [Geminocystis sp. NIES-3709]|uniref:metal ABC transporter solute-binding protein, Zn/Mn family n=1 Tax=Geminocystis sp. NIES-3709 TaxID=1617448 RepID=UPI00082660A4|nr:zinc ABC transporter substrate-binding protein [Geminocystis sp. NIES-3709]